MTMSDCSTNAMKPKEFPNNCGNCEHVCYGVFDVICPYPRYEGQEPYEHGHYRQCKLDKPCEKHVVRQGTLEQRCKQLEQVAKELYKEYEQMEVELCDFIGYGKLRDKYVGGTVFKSHLANLGVSLDD